MGLEGTERGEKCSSKGHWGRLLGEKNTVDREGHALRQEQDDLGAVKGEGGDLGNRGRR